MITGIAEVAIPAGFTPDTISSDIHVFSGNTPGMPFLPNVMSKFMAMGFSLEQVVTMTTTAGPDRDQWRAVRPVLSGAIRGEVGLAGVLHGP